MDPGSGTPQLRLRLSEPVGRCPASLDSPVRPNRSPLVREIGLDGSCYGTHTMRRTKAALIYRRTKNLRAVQLLLEHSKLEGIVRFLGIEVDDALEISEQTEA
jgi:hypothetical protein